MSEEPGAGAWVSVGGFEVPVGHFWEGEGVEACLGNVLDDVGKGRGRGGEGHLHSSSRVVVEMLAEYVN